MGVPGKVYRNKGERKGIVPLTFLLNFLGNMAKKQTKKSAPEMSEAELEKVRQAANKLAAAHQLVVHDVTFGPTDFGLTLSVMIKAGTGAKAVSVSDCETISRPLAKELDEVLDNFGEEYLFEVTSVGIEGE